MGHVYRQKGRIVWQIKYYRDGKAIYESSRSKYKRVAEGLLKDREGAIERGEAVSSRINQLRFDEAIADVLADYRVNARRSLNVAERRVKLHLEPFFGARRMVAIDTPLIREYILARKATPIVAGAGDARRERPPSNGEINRELTLLKRAFSLAIAARKLITRPEIPLLEERNVRRGFFEADQVDAVCRHLPEVLAAVVRFAAITGWRVPSEVLTLQWHQVDLNARLAPTQEVSGVVRLEPGTTKNREGRDFPCTRELRELLEARAAERDQAKQAGHVTPWVFFRMVSKGRGGKKRPKPIKAFTKAWTAACRAAGCPGRVPHDLRRTAVRNLVRSGVPQSVAMRLTGHRTDSVFRRYDIVADVDLAGAASKLERVRV